MVIAVGVWYKTVEYVEIDFAMDSTVDRVKSFECKAKTSWEWWLKKRKYHDLDFWWESEKGSLGCRFGCRFGLGFGGGFGDVCWEDENGILRCIFGGRFGERGGRGFGWVCERRHFLE